MEKYNYPLKIPLDKSFLEYKEKGEDLKTKVNNDTFLSACRAKKFELVKWMYLVNPSINLSYANDRAFKIASMNNDIELAKWLILNKPDVNVSDDDDISLMVSCQEGNIKFLEWLYSINPNINFKAHNSFAFISSCSNGHLDVAKWLLSHEPNFDISIKEYGAFRFAITKNHFEIAKWLYELYPDINLYADENYSFRICCKNGYLNILKWLFTISNYKNINDKSFMITLFCCACYYEQPHIANWFFSIVDDKSFFNTDHLEKVFKSAIKEDKVNLVVWLSYLSKKFRYTLVNNKIKDSWIRNKNINYSESLKETKVYECCVCYERSYLKTDCGHSICEKCFLKISNVCPYCRNTIKKYFEIIDNPINIIPDTFNLVLPILTFDS